MLGPVGQVATTSGTCFSPGATTVRGAPAYTARWHTEYFRTHQPTRKERILNLLSLNNWRFGIEIYTLYIYSIYQFQGSNYFM